jgi:hypothetical protein
MIGALPAFPGSRILAGWWRQLAPFQPRLFWIARLHLARIEALVRLNRRQPLDAFTALVLRALMLGEAPPLEQIDERLRLGRQLLCRVLDGLQRDGLARSERGRWTATPLAEEALRRGYSSRTVPERRSFFFVIDAAGPRFISLDGGLVMPQPLAPDADVDLTVLKECLAKPDEWKRRRNFPVEVEGLAESGEEWERVAVLDGCSLLAAIILVGAGAEERLLGFAVQPEGWRLEPEPAFSLGADWRETLPGLDDPPREQWLQSWLGWCQPRGLSRTDSEACRLERQQWRLRVVAAQTLFGKLRAARSEALKGETWLLAGQGERRAAAQVEVVECPG